MHLRDSEVESQSHGVGMQLLEEREADRNNSLLSSIHMSTAARECAQHDAASAVRARAAARHANEAPKLFAAQRLFERQKTAARTAAHGVSTPMPANGWMEQRGRVDTGKPCGHGLRQVCSGAAEVSVRRSRESGCGVSDELVGDSRQARCKLRATRAARHMWTVSSMAAVHGNARGSATGGSVAHAAGTRARQCGDHARCAHGDGGMQSDRARTKRAGAMDDRGRRVFGDGAAGRWPLRLMGPLAMVRAAVVG